MLLSGVAGTALMLGVGLTMVTNAPVAGPDQEATWPTGETMTLTVVPGGFKTRDLTPTCTVTLESGSVDPSHWFTLGTPNAPTFTGDATVNCDEEVALLTGTPRVIAEYTRGPLITVPLFVAGLGILCFFPRFTHGWARLSTSGWLSRLLRIPPPR